MKSALVMITVGLTIILTALCCTLLVIYLPTQSRAGSSTGCSPRMFSSDSIVCVCSSSYCDTLSLIPPMKDQVVSYTTSKSGLRFEEEELSVQQSSSPEAEIFMSINTNERFQKMKGFGGAFTDAAGINILSLSERAQEHLLQSYFSPKGIEYNLARVPISSCDFSTRLYTYADTPEDFTLEHFKLEMEDFTYKIPLIKRAKKMSTRNISLFASSWSAPAWMKTNNNLTGKGSLIGSAGNNYHKTWAMYYARFIEEYRANGVDMWGLTTQNEPRAGLIEGFPFQCMGFTAEQQRDFVKTDLGPILHSRGHQDIKLMVGDDQRTVLPEWAETVLSDKDAAKYVSGIAVHWYTDWISDPKRLSRTHELYPDYFILGTEACAGAMPWDREKIQLGNWVRGERYSIDILQDLTNWAVGWVDWNLALDMRGGPNWVKNFVDAPIIVNSEEDEFYKQPTYYHMGHFSKFIPEGSVRVAVEELNRTEQLKFAAFLHPDGSTVSLILLNISDQQRKINIVIEEKKTFLANIPEHSIQTYLWQ